MKIEHYNLYTYFILIIQNRLPLIIRYHREVLEKYITGIVNNNIERLVWQQIGVCLLRFKNRCK